MSREATILMAMLMLPGAWACRDAETTTELFAPPEGPDLSGGLVRVTFDPDPDEQPAWIPTGETIAYTLRTGLFLLDLTGGKREALQSELLFSESFHLSPTWAPDGTALAFIRVSPPLRALDSEKRFLMVREVRVGGAGRVLLALTCPPDCRRPSEVAWSPSGDLLAVVTVEGISLLPISGGQLSFLVGTGGGTNPTWHPGGAKLAFVQGGMIRVLVVASGVIETLTEGAHPAWSPDGESIAFDRRGELLVIPAGGGRAKPVTPIPATDPTWGPQGSRLMFVSGEGGNPDLWMIRLGE